MILAIKQHQYLKGGHIISSSVVRSIVNWDTVESWLTDCCSSSHKAKDVLGCFIRTLSANYKL